jgi:eukaryotic-like serine/threonine-protein kinase
MPCYGTAERSLTVMEASEIQPGDILREGRYEVQEVLGTPRDKKILLAHDRRLGCQVILDVFANNSLILPGGLTVSSWEAQVLGKLGDHPNIATVLDQWEDDKTAFMATRYLPGGTLRDLIARSQPGKGLPIDDILRLSAEIAHGLAHIHERRILYCDLQPRNVLFDEWGSVHLVDFDTAVSLDAPNVSDLSRRPVIDYMAPELVEGTGADERADLYSLGATIYEMAVGRPPFAGTREEIVAAIQAGPPAPLHRDDLPQALNDLVTSLLAREPAKRPTSAAEVAQLLEGLRAGHDDIGRLLASDESMKLEFKSSLRTPVGSPKPGETRSLRELGQVLEREVLETVAAFHNTEGGTLVVGVADDRKIVGIEVDYPRAHGSSDGWRCTFDNLVSHHLGVDALKCIDLQLEPWQGRTIAVIRCSPRKDPSWIDDQLYVRRTGSTVKLSTRDAVAWCHERWG